MLIWKENLIYFPFFDSLQPVENQLSREKRLSIIKDEEDEVNIDDEKNRSNKNISQV